MENRGTGNKTERVRKQEIALNRVRIAGREVQIALDLMLTAGVDASMETRTHLSIALVQMEAWMKDALLAEGVKVEEVGE